MRNVVQTDREILFDGPLLHGVVFFSRFPRSGRASHWMGMLESVWVVAGMLARRDRESGWKNGGWWMEDEGVSPCVVRGGHTDVVSALLLYTIHDRGLSFARANGLPPFAFFWNGFFLVVLGVVFLVTGMLIWGARHSVCG
jgi:hypothetical protein